MTDEVVGVCIRDDDVIHVEFAPTPPHFCGLHSVTLRHTYTIFPKTETAILTLSISWNMKVLEVSVT